MTVSILWFRQDLRLHDNPALQAALQRGGSIVPVYIHSEAEEGAWRPGAAAQYWLRENLLVLADALRQRGSRLWLAQGPALPILRHLCTLFEADAVYWNRRYEPAIVERDRVLKQSLRAAGLLAESRNGASLLEPWEISNQSAKPFLVFTPFWKQALKQLNPTRPAEAPAQIPSPAAAISTANEITIEHLFPLPQSPWHVGIREHWPAGEQAARLRLAKFSAQSLDAYAHQRDRPAVDGTSRLSPYLHVGALSPNQIWHAVGDVCAARGSLAAEWRTHKFLAELLWREFSCHLLYHHPHLCDEPLRSEFKRFEWRTDSTGLQRWQRGQTGIPLVDAGMRELWHTGWMHNRVRMVVASFLVKNLRIHWLQGARWFWDTLIDADLANNTQGWQWAAGCGADAAPYFRVFNPETQAAKFDPDGEYIRRWAPELSARPTPIVDLKASRAEALAAFQRLRKTSV